MTEAMDEITEGKATPAQIGAFLSVFESRANRWTKLWPQQGDPLENRDAAHRDVDVCLDRDEINVDQETVADTCAFGKDLQPDVQCLDDHGLCRGGRRPESREARLLVRSQQMGKCGCARGLGAAPDLTPRQVSDCVGPGWDRILLCYPAGWFHASSFRSQAGTSGSGPSSIMWAPDQSSRCPCSVLGVYKKDFTEKVAQALRKLGCEHGLVVCGQDSYDEPEHHWCLEVTRLFNGEIGHIHHGSRRGGTQDRGPEEIIGGNAAENAAITRAVLNGEKGARRDMVLLNAAAVLTASGKVATLQEGVRLG